MNRQRLSNRPLPARKLPLECLCCSEENPWILNKVNFTTPFRNTQHQFRAEVHECRHCDAVITTEEQSAVISAQVKEAHRKWIAEQFKRAQGELGLSLRKFAEKSSIPFATLGRVSAGEHLIEATMETLLWQEIERLTHKYLMERLVQMRQCEFQVTDGSVQVKSNPIIANIYSAILQTAAQSPLGKCSPCEAKESFSDLSHNNPVPA